MVISQIAQKNINEPNKAKDTFEDFLKGYRFYSPSSIRRISQDFWFKTKVICIH